MGDDQGPLKRKPGFATLSIHAGLNPDQWNGAIVPPIVLTAMYKQPSNGNLGYTYSRTANPMRDTLETCLAAPEGGKHAFTFASGHGVIMSVLALLSKGDHIVSMDNVYGGTGQVMRENLPKLGIDLTFTDVRNVRNLENAIQDNTKVPEELFPYTRVTSLLYHEEKDSLVGNTNQPKLQSDRHCSHCSDNEEA